MSEYQLTAIPVGDHFSVGTLVFLHIHKQVLSGEFGRIPKPLSEWAFSMSSYCLDAPSVIPAGSCVADELPMQSMIYRESLSAS